MQGVQMLRWIRSGRLADKNQPNGSWSFSCHRYASGAFGRGVITQGGGLIPKNTILVKFDGNLVFSREINLKMRIPQLSFSPINF